MSSTERGEFRSPDVSVGPRSAGWVVSGRARLAQRLTQSSRPEAT